jgi:hypothetical protein
MNINKNDNESGLTKTSNQVLEPDWALTITKADNGYVLTHVESLSDGYKRTYFEVIEEHLPGDASPDVEVDAAIRLLWSVLERFGVYKGIEIKAREEE